MKINSFSMLDETVHVTPQVMWMLGELLEREVTADDPEWSAAMALITVSEKVRIKPSRRQHKENERDCRTIVQELVPSIPQNVLTSAQYKRREQSKWTQRKTVTFEDQDQKGEEVDKTWGKKDCPGRRTLMGTSEFINKTRYKKVCPESQVKGKCSR